MKVWNSSVDGHMLQRMYKIINASTAFTSKNTERNSLLTYINIIIKKSLSSSWNKISNSQIAIKVVTDLTKSAFQSLQGNCWGGGYKEGRAAGTEVPFPFIGTDSAQ